MGKNAVWDFLEQVAKKQGITEIIINEPDKVFVEKAGQFYYLDVNLPKEDILLFVQDMAKINNKNLNEENPILNGNLEDGSRINIVLEPFAKNCPAITIRKYLKQIHTFDQCPGIFGLSKEWGEFLKVLIQSRCNLFVSGGTGVGKTTFLNLLLQEIPRQQRVVIIEDTRELSADLLNMVSLETSSGNSINRTVLTIRDLVKNSLRMRPDRIIIGEVRGEEIFDLLQAMNTGHDGCISTIHANTPAECLSRIENLFLMAGYDMPIKAVRQQVSSAIDFIIQLGRDKKGNRIVSRISEINNLEGENILTQEIGRHENGALQITGMVPSCIEHLSEHGLQRDFFL